jgi:hypothetical protein
MSQKAQVSAPFELFVAIIIMGFVVVIGSQMLIAANQQVCMNSVDKEMTTFKLYLEDTANRKSSSKFDFQPESCFDKSKAVIKIEKVANSKQCAAACGKPTETCFIFLFNAPDIANGFRQKCLNLSAYTSFFVEEQTCPAGDLDGYEVLKPSDGLKVGSYVLRNVSKAAETYPKICVFYRAV